MKRYSDLYLFGFGKDIKSCQKELSKNLHSDWSCEIKTIGITDYLCFEYKGGEVEKSTIFLLGSEYEGKECVKVANIIPIIVNELSLEQYNAILRKFYNDIVEPTKKSNRLTDIVGPTNDIFSPTDYISEKALDKLKRFCNSANKTTGASHPSDRELWLDFVCQTVDDGRVFDIKTLSDFLADESYWGRRENDMSVSGKFAWGADMANKLASEYEMLCEALKYYKVKRGV